MDLQTGDVWYGKKGTDYEGIQATIDDITARYVQVSFSPPVQTYYATSYGRPLGKHQFMRFFEPYHQITISDFLDF